MGGARGREDVRGAKLAGSLPLFLVGSGRPAVLMLIRSAAAHQLFKAESEAQRGKKRKMMKENVENVGLY